MVNTEGGGDNGNEKNFVRKVGRILGRIVTTIGAAITMRVVLEDMNNQDKDKSKKTLMDHIQLEVPVAATTLIVWNTHLGEETGENVTAYIANTVTGGMFNAAQTTRNNNNIGGFAEGMTYGFAAHISNAAAQGFQGIFGVNPPPPPPRDNHMRF